MIDIKSVIDWPLTIKLDVNKQRNYIVLGCIIALPTTLNICAAREFDAESVRC